jgi:hypothetical protein
VKKVDALYEPYSKEMAKLLATYSDREFELLEDWLGKTTVLLTEHAAELRDKAKR